MPTTAGKESCFGSPAALITGTSRNPTFSIYPRDIRIFATSTPRKVAAIRVNMPCRTPRGFIQATGRTLTANIRRGVEMRV